MGQTIVFLIVLIFSCLDFSFQKTIKKTVAERVVFKNGSTVFLFLFLRTSRFCRREKNIVVIFMAGKHKSFQRMASKMCGSDHMINNSGSGNHS